MNRKPEKKNGIRAIALLLVMTFLLSTLSGCGLTDFIRGGSDRVKNILAALFSCRVTFSYNLKEAGEVPPSQRVKRGERANVPQNAEMEDYVFLGWFPQGKTACPYDFTQPVTKSIRLTGLFADGRDTKDTDGDGLPDAVEEVLGTYLQQEDTDLDGLADGLEFLNLYLDPLSKDTDRNGTEDGDEDTDLDGIGNTEEIRRGTSPVFSDTDGDDLKDGEEVSQYRTDPLNPDTDGDTVTDGNEVRIGSDPTEAETSFITTAAGSPISATNPIHVEVSAVTDAAGAGTVTVTEMVSTDILPLTRANLSYLAPAVSLSCEGKVEEAELVFQLDPSLEKEGIDPVVCWYNPETEELVPVPIQTRENGKITAKVGHFSIFTVIDNAINELIDLLNPVVVDTKTDANGDKLPDEFARQINDGNIPYAKGFLYANVLDMYGDADDWDEDGLLNGEEIEVIRSYGQFIIVRHSDPLQWDTDGDGISDFDEVKLLGTSPTEINHRSEGSLHHLENDGEYSYAHVKKEVMEWLGIALDFKRYRKAEECLINYFYEYAAENVIEKNAKRIQEQAMREEAVKVLGLVSNMLSLSKSIVEMLGSEGKAAEETLRFSTQLETKKHLISVNGSKTYEQVTGASQLLDFRQRTQALYELAGKDKYQQVEELTKYVKLLGNLLKEYDEIINTHVYPMRGLIEPYNRAVDIFSDSQSNMASFGGKMTVAVDVAKGIVDLGQITATYARILANSEAYVNYLEILEYMAKHGREDYVRQAAKTVGKMVLNDNDLFLRAMTACAESITETTFKTVLDLAAKTNPYAMIAKAFIDLYPMTGMSKMADSNIYFDVMGSLSEACTSHIKQLVSRSGNTFVYDGDQQENVEKYMVQLAQSRVVGQYYMAEYLADNSGAGLLSRIPVDVQFLWVNTAGPHKTPQEYRQDFMKRLKTVYDHINKLHLPVSPNLPGYKEYWNGSAAEDPVDLQIDPEFTLRSAQGVYVLTSGMGAWESRILLKGDGTFTGHYYDEDAGFSGTTEDGRAFDATMFELDFSGKFSIGEVLDDYSCELILEEYRYEGTDGEEFIEDNNGLLRHVTSAWGGLDPQARFILYTPSVIGVEGPDWDLFGLEPDYTIGEYFRVDGEERSNFFGRVERIQFGTYYGAYSNFLAGREYEPYFRNFEEDGTYSSTTYDMDGDGIPELLVRKTGTYTGEAQTVVFAFWMGKTGIRKKLTGDIYLLMDPRYPGLFILEENKWVYYENRPDDILRRPFALEENGRLTPMETEEDLYRAFREQERKELAFDPMD